MDTSIYRILGYLQVFVSMGAIGGSLPMLIKTNEMNTEILAGSPFSSFLIPGILLFSIHGVGNAIGAYFSLNFKQNSDKIAAVLGSALIIWIIVQVYFLGLVSWLQPLFLIIGIAELILGILLFKKR
jgi:hypothetical protein